MLETQSKVFIGKNGLFCFNLNSVEELLMHAPCMAGFRHFLAVHNKNYNPREVIIGIEDVANYLDNKFEVYVVFEKE